jgi:D-alanine-D-alanine ligase
METIAVIFGGRSAEHDVSIVTALASIMKPLELTKKYKVEAVYIAKDGAWYWDEKLKDIKLFTSGNIQDYLHKAQPASIQLDGGMTLVKSSGIAGRKQTRTIDLVFPAMHGTYGEDGALMGLLDMAGIPYVGCGVSAAAVCMDKVLAKQLAVANGIPVSTFLTFTKADLERELSDAVKSIVKTLQFPLFVKPAHLGSSIGISRVTNERELRNGFSQIPADLPKALYERAQSVGLGVYKALGCSGIARVDMLIDDKSGNVYFNEVNPLPGGLYAHNWNQAGISNVDLVQKLVGFAKERHAQRQALTTTFSTNYLQQF